MSILELTGITKNFGGIHALAGVDIKLERGQVLGLMGDNGAGKSTLIKIIAGSFPPTSGTIRLDGKTVTFARPREARDAGIEVVHQDLALCDNLTASMNVFLGREIVRKFGPFQFLNRAAMNERSAELFADLKSETRPKDLVRQMSGGQRQAVAIARTRLSKPNIVIMDEPTAGMAPRGYQCPAGCRSAGPDPASESRGARSHTHQSPDARRICCLRPGRGLAARGQSR